MAPSSLKRIRTQSKRELVDFLTREIDEYYRDSAEPGWTKWAIMGGFGTVAWLLLSQFSTERLDYLDIAALLHLASLAIICLSSISLAEFKPPSRFGGRFRFRIASDVLQTKRYYILLILARNVAILPLIPYVQVDWPVYAVLSTIFHAIAIAFILLMLVFSVFRIPLPTSGVEPSSATRFRVVFASIIAVGSLITIFKYLAHFVNSHALVPFEELKTVALILAIYGITTLWLSASPSKRLISELVNIRRDIEMGEISLKEAFNRANIVINGLATSEILQEYFDQYLDLMAKIARNLDVIAEIDDEIEKILVNKKDINITKLKKANALFKSVDENMAEAQKQLGLIRSRVFRPLNWRIVVMATASPGSVIPDKRVTREMEAMTKEASTKMRKISNRGDRFAKLLAALDKEVKRKSVKHNR